MLPQNMGFSHWADLMNSLLPQASSIGIGIFSIDGSLLYCNKAMSFFLDNNEADKHQNNFFVNPTFSFFLEKDDELVFDGLATIGNYLDISYVLSTKVFRKEDQILVYAEADVLDLFEGNRRMSHLNQEVNNLQRQLIKEKKQLEATLSELKETQQMLIHSEKMNALGKLVAGVAHELNNPIAFVYGNLYSLDKYVGEVFDTIRQIEHQVELSENKNLMDSIAEICKRNDLGYLEEDISDMTKESKVGVERVKNIVEDLRRFSRLDESDLKQVDLIENIRSTISIARAEINLKNIDFRLESDEEIQVECFPGQLNQAILNVLMNAVQAVENGGKVTLTVLDQKTDVLISVKDNGCGIPENIKSRIFEPFFTTKPVGSGTGLGLSITHKIIHDLHHGKIEVESIPLLGTEIKLTVPKKI